MSTVSAAAQFGCWEGTPWLVRSTGVPVGASITVVTVAVTAHGRLVGSTRLSNEMPLPPDGVLSWEISIW